jgi:hypothetical protein
VKEIKMALSYKVYFKYIYLVFIILLMNSLMVNADDKNNIAIVDLEGKGVSMSDASSITDILRSAMVNSHEFTVLERENMKSILAEQQFQSTGCTDQKCIVKMGKLLNVKKMIYGNISKVGRIYYTVVNVVDVETGKIEVSEQFDTNSIEKIPSKINKMPKRILKAIELENKLAKYRIQHPVMENKRETTSLKDSNEPNIDEKQNAYHYEKENRKIQEYLDKSHTGYLGIGLQYWGLSLKYFSGLFSYELKSVFADTATGYGPRLYLNFNPNSDTVFYIGGEYCIIKGKTDLQNFTGSSAGGFIGMELFSHKKYSEFLGSEFFDSLFLDIGPYITTFNSEFSGVSITNSDIVCNLGFNIYF